MTKKSINIFAACILLLLVSCRKEPGDGHGGVNLCPYYYNDLDPNLMLPMPAYGYSDSLVMDIDKDSINDLVFYNYYGPGQNDPAYDIKVVAKNDTKFLYVTYPHEPCDSPLAENTKLDSSMKTIDEWTFRFCLDLIQYDESYFDKGGYFAIRLNKQGKYYLGWMYVKVDGNTLIIDKYAINTCANEAIVVGKK